MGISALVNFLLPFPQLASQRQHSNSSRAESCASVTEHRASDTVTRRSDEIKQEEATKQTARVLRDMRRGAERSFRSRVSLISIFSEMFPMTQPFFS